MKKYLKEFLGLSRSSSNVSLVLLISTISPPIFAKIALLMNGVTEIFLKLDSESLGSILTS